MAFNFDGVLFEIFSNLPTKAICKLAATCEEAHNLVSSYPFMKKQSVNMLTRDDLGFILQFGSLNEMVELHPLNVDDSSCHGLPSTTLHFLSKTVHILTSANGLLFCVDRDAQNLLMINPATKSWLDIPIPHGLSLSGAQRTIKVVLDCNNGDSMDYKVMVLTQDPKTEWFSPTLLLRMFSTKEGTWKEIGEVDCGGRQTAFDHMPLYIKYTETLYLLADYWLDAIRDRNSPFYWPYVVACNIKKFESRLLKFPKDARKGLYSNDCRMDIFRWGRQDVCMVQLSKGMFRVWVLQSKGKWVRIMRTRARAMIGKGLKMGSDVHILGFTVLNGKSLLFATRDKVYRYDLRGCYSKLGEVGADEICGHEYAEVGTVFFHSYSNALRPCGDGATPMPIHIP